MKELAYYCYPCAPCGNYREYTAEELKDPKTLESVFDLCQIYEARITADGWYFLIGHYGFQQLYEIDKKSGWFDEDTFGEYVLRVCEEIRSEEEVRAKTEAETEMIELRSTPDAIRDLKAYAESKGMSPQALLWTAVDEYRHTRGELHTPFYIIQFHPDKGHFFSLNCAAEKQFGYRVMPGALPLSPDTAAAIRALYQDYEQFRNPDNPHGRPDVPPEQIQKLSARADALYEKMKAELGADYMIRKPGQWF